MPVESNPAPAIETKPWYKSRAIWSAIVTAALGIIQAVSAQTGHPIPIPDYVYAVLAGMGIYTARTADKPIA